MKKTLMVPRKLPSELEEEIFVRLPPLSVVRFKAVCKEWNTLFNAKRFANNHFACARPEFLVRTESNIYSIRVNLSEDPTVTVIALSIYIPSYIYGNCDGYLLYNDDRKGTVICNPWLRQTKRIDPMEVPSHLCGIGYNCSKPGKSYKIFGSTYFLSQLHECDTRFSMFEFETNAWKFIDHVHNLAGARIDEPYHENNVIFKGNVYWIAYNHETGKSFIEILDLSREIIKPFCILPCKMKDHTLTHALAVYKGDRFSLLEQCLTRKIEIWVTKNKISNGDDEDAVVWIKFMTVSIPNFPRYDQYNSSRRYLVDNNIYGKTFVMCCSDGTGRIRQASVYVVMGDLCKRIKIDDVGSRFYRFSVYVPSLIPFTLDEEN